MKNPTLEVLAAKLQELDAALEDPALKQRCVTERGFIGDVAEEAIKPLVDDVVELADMLLIVGTGPSAGGCRWDRHNELNRRWGYRVGPGEQDSFGWLSGIIHGRNFKIVYG